MPGAKGASGFTLVEMSVALVVGVILMAIALPSFQATRQRAALRAAAEQSLGFWNQARFEAAKRNSMVKVGLRWSSAGYCLGAATTTDRADAVTCDCTTDAPADATLTCNVARFPSSQTQWNDVTVTAATLGDATLLTATKPAVIDSKRTSLTESADDGTITFLGPPGRRTYQLRMSVDRFGRAVLCEPTSATDKMSDYNTKRCSP